MTESPLPESAAPEVPVPERYPFWNYSDLFIFIGLSFPSLLVGAVLVKAAVLLLRLPVENRIYEILPAQFSGYAILFGLLWLLLRVQYGRPFWASLRWVRPALPVSRLVAAGAVLAIAVAGLSLLLRAPDVDSPMKEFLSSRTSVLLLAIFGTTLGPLCEELAFRGFMQPLFVRTLGPVAGVLLAALPFGLLHLQQYGWSWRHGLLIALAGAGFGWMRHTSGSTRAAAVMHMAYNATFFVALAAQKKEFPTTW